MIVVVEGKPQGKQRPRFSRGRTYTPAKTVDYENRVKEAWIKAGRERVTAPLHVRITAVFDFPKGFSKKRRAELIGKAYTNKPDCDNIAKVCLDALNGLAYDDDAGVAQCLIRKVYGYTAQVVIEIWEEENAKI